MNLFPYQQEGATFLAERRTAYLADDPGLGKSAQAVTACLQVGAKSVRIICPASLRENWKREFAKFGGGHINLDVMSYEGAVKALTKKESPLSTDVLICDEAHYLQSKASDEEKRSKRCRAVLGEWLHLSEKVWYLSGTPARATPIELFPILEASFKDAIYSRSGRPMTFWQFARKFCKLTNNGYGVSIGGGKNLEELRQRISPYFLRRKKDEVLTDLPELLIGTVTVEPSTISKVHKQAETELEEKILKALEEGGIEALAALGPHVSQLRRIIGLAKVKPTFDLMMEELAYTSKIVVFGWHIDVLDGLASLLKKEGIEYSRVDGSTMNRQDAVDRFQNDESCRVFLGNIMAAGTGLTLTAASSLLVIEQSWTPADNAQAIMRIHRIGQKDACLARFVALAGSIDERIAEVCAEKTKVLNQLGF